MKAWILISFYLLKDIWRRWFETPGGVFSRLLVAFILGMLLLVIDAAFTISAVSIQNKISQMGVRTIVISRVVNSAEADTDYLSKLIAPLRNDGEVLRLMQTGKFAIDETGAQRTVYIYDRTMLEVLLPALPAKPESDAFVISKEFPPGMRTSVNMGRDAEIDAITILPPSWLSKFGANPSAVLLPQEPFVDLTDNGFLELIVFLGSDNSDIVTIDANLRAMMELENIGNVQISSPKELLEQLNELQNTQRQWRGGFGVFGGLAVALVFGSISILEYRQNRYIIALLRSFGTPSILLISRYLLESVALVTIAGVLARETAILLHPLIFQTIGIEPNFMDLEEIDPYAWALVWRQLGGLGAGAFLSVIPVAFAMRTQVGKILT